MSRRKFDSCVEKKVSMSFPVPIALIVFNRPELVKALVESLRILAPEVVYVISDGPRMNSEGKCLGDEANVLKVRKVIDDEVDWSCAVHKIYRPSNLGCGFSPAQGISEVLAKEEKLIVLEEDCIADPTFFPFCEELLQRYANDERVMTISGSRFYPARKEMRASYHFSKFQHIWGWATWRRAWEKMDYSMQRYKDFVTTDCLGKYLGSRISGSYWRRNYQTILDGRTDVWDYQWQLACWANKGLCIQPKVNLINNVGVLSGGTHSSGSTHHQSLKPNSIEFPLRHPDAVFADEKYDRRVRDHFFSEGKLRDLIKFVIKG